MQYVGKSKLQHMTFCEEGELATLNLSQIDPRVLQALGRRGQTVP